MFDFFGGRVAKKPSVTFYRHILREAWDIMKKNKALWLLGFFVSFLGNGGVYELLVQGAGRLGLQDDFGSLFTLGLLPGWTGAAGVIRTVGASNIAVLALIGLTVGALAIVALWIVLSAQGGLIAGIRETARGRRTRFGSLFAAGNETFGPLFVVNLLSRAAITVCFYLLLALTILYLTSASLINVFAYLVGFLLFVPITLVIGFVTIYAACYVVLQRLSIVAAVESAIALFRKYWLISLETALILFGVNLLAALGIGAVGATAAVALVPFLIGASLLQSSAGIAIVAAVAALLGVLFLAFVGALLAAYQYAVWVTLFNKLHVRGHGGKSKLARWFDRLLR